MDYDKKLYDLHQLYLQHLDRTMKEYPAYNVGQTNQYQEELSLLNGISKQIDQLHVKIKEDLTSMSRMIQRSDTAIKQIKQIETNLKNYTSMDQLDVTSKQMLADAKQEYNDEKLYFFIKASVTLLILIHLIRKKKYILLAIFIPLSFLVAFLINSFLVNKIAQ